MRKMEFRVWDNAHSNMRCEVTVYSETRFKFMDAEDDTVWNCPGDVLMQFTGLKDKNGKEIYEGDILQFSNRREWFRLDLFLKNKEEQNEILNNLKEYPYERRVIEIPTDYAWMLDDEIQRYWEVIGNIYENVELLI